ncbi:hypothetical protein, partial [Paramuribaculum intestinale]|uniref:hypothetical protein n=1 Tax=Paramuribaculum intestinale TaxID=2094151 RepID=UPI0025A94633
RGTLPRLADARQWASCRSEPGILSARTLRGSDSAIPSGRGGGRAQYSELSEMSEAVGWIGGVK